MRGRNMTRKMIAFLAILSFLFLSACDAPFFPTKPDYGKRDTGSVSSTTGFGRQFDGSGTSTSSRGGFTRKFSSRSSSRRDGATLHAIIVADTDDPNIGKSVEVDLKRLENLVKEIANNTGLSLTGGSLFGDSFTKSNILTVVNDLSVGPDDVVWFYNSSHGFNSGGGEWPDIYAGTSGIPLNNIADIIKSKNPRLSIVMADVCNKSLNRAGYDSSRAGGKAENYKELFLKYKGTIIASSSIKGQYSWGNAQMGGLFTNAFLGELGQELIVSDRRPSWETLMERATQPIQNSSEPQQPQAEVNVRATGDWGGPVNCETNRGHPDCVGIPGCPPSDPNCPSRKKNTQSIFKHKF